MFLCSQWATNYGTGGGLGQEQAAKVEFRDSPGTQLFAPFRLCLWGHSLQVAACQPCMAATHLCLCATADCVQEDDAIEEEEDEEEPEPVRWVHLVWGQSGPGLAFTSCAEPCALISAEVLYL